MNQTTGGLNSHNAKQISDLFTLSMIKRACSPLCLAVAVSHGQKCAEGHFACPSGNCISSVWLCDGQKDCEDGADEFQCGKHGWY